MPQGDILSFGCTLLFLPIGFLGGYYLWSTTWVPRLFLVIKTRNWVTTFRVGMPVLLSNSGSADGWPEIFLMFIQFSGLIWCLTQLNLNDGKSTSTEGLFTSLVDTHVDLTFQNPQTVFMGMWFTHRKNLFFGVTSQKVHQGVVLSLESMGFVVFPKQFPILGVNLQKRLTSFFVEEKNYMSNTKDTLSKTPF